MDHSASATDPTGKSAAPFPAGEVGSFARSLGTVEHLIWLIDRAGSLNFCTIADLNGPLAEADLRAALARVQARHPLLRTRIEPDGRHLGFAGWAPGQGPEIPLAIVDAPSGVAGRGGDGSVVDREPAAEPWVGVTETEIHERFPEEGPLVRCTWVRRGGESSTLMLTFNHIIGDGISGSYLLRDLVQSVQAIAAGGDGRLPPLPLPTPLERHVPATGRGLRGLWGLAKIFARQLRSFLRFRGRPRKVRVDGNAPVGERRSRICGLELPAARTRALRDRARAEGTTVHGALMAALARALAEELDPPGPPAVVNVGSPVNMRQRMDPPVGEDVGLFVGIAQGIGRIEPGGDFWALARQLKDDTGANVELDMPVVMVPFLSRIAMWRRIFPLDDRGAARMAALTEKLVMRDSTTGVTNVGALDLDPGNGPLRLERAHFAVATSAMGRLVATAASLDGRLRINLMGQEPLVPAARTAAVARRMEALLVKA